MEIGDRVKRYEYTSKTSLLPRGYIVLRVDGRSFHRYTISMDKPFDTKLVEAMVTAGEKTAKEMMGFVLGYHQSDEFTFVLTDTMSHESEMWFDGEVQKLCSITASLFTGYFNREMNTEKIAAFDCRAFNVPKDDVANVFVWRQRDWERNSLQMLARSVCSHKSLQNKNHTAIHEMLFEKGLNWADLPEREKNGTFILKGGERICKKLDYNGINALLGIEC